MSDCPLQFQVNAYHDGELDGDAARRFAEHLAGCQGCQEQLASLEAVSALFAALPQRQMYPIELGRLHQRLESNTARKTADSEFLRAAGFLSALAASILVISSVWLAEIPSRPAAALSPGVAVVPASDLPAWERTALTLRVEPSSFLQEKGSFNPGTGDAIPQTGLADARAFNDNSVDAQVADWMVAGLDSGNR
jgi:anti-sigma factor RsiW